MKKVSLPFEFSGKMARLLGRESVSNEVTALFELVKNSYDADATKVKISFLNFSKDSREKPTIIIEDDGYGMTYNELKENWLVIGTYSKDKHQRSKKGRRVVGNKGIGRFATEKLSGRMTLISNPKNVSETTTLDVNWAQYEKEDITFNDIQNEVVIDAREDKTTHGTKIILTDIRDDWSKDKIIRLRHAVSSIVIPEEIVPAVGDNFEVIIDDPDFKTSVEKKVFSLLFKKAPFKITAKLSNKNNIARIHLIKEGKEIEIVSKNLDEKKSLNSNTNWKHFGKCSFHLYFYPGDSKFEKWSVYYKKALKIKKVHDILQDFAGVKIYRDGFMVRPYGEKGNDWLDLDKERVMSNLKVGNNQVVGIVEISSDNNPKIIDTTTRERLVENTEFASMRFFVKESISVLNKYRMDEVEKRKEESVKLQHENVVENEVNYLFDIISDLELPRGDKKTITKSLRTISKTFSDYIGETEQEHEEYEQSRRTFRNMTSLGISTATSSHEIHNVLAIMSELPKSIKIQLNKTQIDKKKILDKSDEISELIKTIKEFLAIIRQFVTSAKNDYESKSSKEKIILKPTIEDLFEKFTSIVIRKKISVKVRSFPDDLTIYMNKADLFSILLNLLTNSLKALDLLPSKSERIIRLTVEKQAYNLKITYSNNGPNIPSKHQEKIFELFESRYEDGTGLGLPIVKEILEEYEGHIEVKPNPEFEPGATFDIKIPLENIKK